MTELSPEFLLSGCALGKALYLWDFALPTHPCLPAAFFVFLCFFSFSSPPLFLETGVSLCLK